MNVFPNWLPEMVLVNPWTQMTFNLLYAIFERDFKQTRLTYDGFEIWFFPEMEDGREVIFWHLTHKDDKTAGARIPDLRRAERLPWARCLIDNATKPEILAWDYREAKGTTQTYLWLKDYNYVLLMKKYPNGQRRLLTSFYVDYSHYARKLQKKYDGRLNKEG